MIILYDYYHHKAKKKVWILAKPPKLLCLTTYSTNLFPVQSKINFLEYLAKSMGVRYSLELTQRDTARQYAAKGI